MKSRHCLLATLLLCAASAQASPPEAWQEQDKRMLAACTKLSGLKEVKAAGQPVLFDDRLGITALTLSGRYPQAHMKNRTGRELCLYQRKSGKAFISEADNLIDARKP
ncbi:hypothetical protein ACSC9U_08515 [Pseudomonas solani]|uniref:hypothetical protein n=1 Tax=Pseudomonas solani TaxID=2731552 RepID=UPI003F4AA1A8